MSDEEKTEDPTPKKLEDAREKGDVAQSRELANFIVFVGLSLAVYFSAPSVLVRVSKIFSTAFKFEPQLIDTKAEFFQVISDIMEQVFWILAPLFSAAVVFSVFAYTSQFGILFTLEKLNPKPEKLDPIKGFKKIFSRDTLIEFVKSVAKVSILAAIFYILFKSELPAMLSLGSESVGNIFIYTMGTISKFALAFIIFLAVLGVFDFAYQKWSFHEKNKMSMQEVKDEYKNREGDPHVKGRIRQLQREMARERMMDDVPNADVIVANPTHVAVAIQYKRGNMMAPKVVAKGAGHLALKIKELAILHGVPVMEKKQLARFLYRNAEVGDYVPESLYSAVAEVLAFVYKMKKKYRSIGGWLGDSDVVKA